jgi:hypothetical protein
MASTCISDSNQFHHDPPPALLALVDIPESLKVLTDIQSLLQNLTFETFDETVEILQNTNPSYLEEIYAILGVFHDIRPHKAHLISKLLQSISAQSSSNINSLFFISHHPYLAAKLAQSNIITESDALHFKSRNNFFRFFISPSTCSKWSVPECFQDDFRELGQNFVKDVLQYGYREHSLGYILKYDDFDSLQSLSTQPNFDFDSSILISPCDLPSQVEEPKAALLAVSAFYGSINCFKFLYLNDCAACRSVCSWGVKRGNLEILQICEHEHGDFRDCLRPSIIYNQNEIADWLLNNFSVQNFTFKDCIESLNFTAFLFLLANGVEVNGFITVSFLLKI